MKTRAKKSLDKLRFNKVTIAALTNNEKKHIEGGASADCDARTGVPCIAVFQKF